MLSEQLLGRRVVLRYRRHKPDNLPPLADVVGILAELTADSVVVDTRSGPRSIDRTAVVQAKEVTANRRDILELERISRLGWRAAERTELDGWLLCSDQGWTGRANSALPLATSQRPLEQLLAEVRAHFEARDLLAQIQVPLPARALLDAELARRGWTVARPTIVLTLPLAGQSPANICTFADEPDDDWIAAYHYRGGRLPDFAVELLTRHDLVTFASVQRHGRTTAIGRGVIDEGWLGITAIDIAPEFRRQGLATAVMRDLFGWGIAQGTTDCYLQVDESNEAALRLYAGLGFIEHHRYHYRVAPDRA